RNASLDGLAPGARLLAHLLHRLGRRTDERDAGVRAGARALRVLREEAVPRVDRVGAGGLAGGDHVLDREVALARGRRAHAHRFVAGAHVQGGAIGVAVDGDGGDAHLLAGAGDAEGDLA